jgi:hypothetical protein
MKQLREEIEDIVGGIDWMPETVLKAFFKEITDKINEIIEVINAEEGL